METKWRKIEGGETVETPCWLTDGKNVVRIDVAFMWPIFEIWTHWQPAEPVPEPPREPSQAELDEKACVEFDTEMFESWMLGDPCAREIRRCEYHAAWMIASGLARKHERAEIAKMLPTMKIPYTAHEEAHTMGRAIAAIRARCNGGSS